MQLTIPGTDFAINFGWFYIVIVIFWLVGFSNAVNLTDGLDGLVSGTSAIAFGAFAVFAWNQSQYDVAIFSVAVVGAVLGFLVFNAHPAKVFMGDTGSLALRWCDCVNCAINQFGVAFGHYWWRICH